MGADGGVVWVRVKDRSAVPSLLDWILPFVLNPSAQTYKGDFAGPIPEAPFGDCLEGGYGTDCGFGLRDLCDLIPWLLDDEFDWAACSGMEDVRNYTFAELVEAAETDPNLDLHQFGRPQTQPWNVLDPIYEPVRFHILYERNTIPDVILAMSLRDWARAVSETIDVNDVIHVETWT